MQLAGIDLNLLVALDALLVERNVTRAARRLGVSQPAVSHALRRLRELLGDPLLVRARQGMTATPRALALVAPVRTALEAAEAVLRAPAAFDPATARRTFAISAVDQSTFVVLPRLAERLGRDAPGIHLDVRAQSADGLGDVLDLAIGVFGDAPPTVHEETLWHEDFVCVLRRNSPASRGAFDKQRYLALPHLLVAPRGDPGGLLDNVLARTGERRTVALRVPHFLVAPHIIATTDLVWTAPASIARAFAAQLPLVIREPPVRLAGFDVKLRWHARLAADPGVTWLRGLLRELVPAS